MAEGHSHKTTSWITVAILVVASVVLGIALVAQSVALAVIGGVLVVAGVVLGAVGGIMEDAH